MKAAQSNMLVIVGIPIGIAVTDLLVQRSQDMGSALVTVWEGLHVPALFFALIAGALTNTVHMWSNSPGADTWWKIWFFIGQCVQWESIGFIVLILVDRRSALRRRTKSLVSHLMEPPDGSQKDKR